MPYRETFCVCVSQETREGVVLGALEGGARREGMRKGERYDASLHPAAIAQQHPAWGESPSKTHLSKRCNKAKMGA